jgi:MoaA/NifB/PqqE/SkfB family radical SAM enzyme
MDCKNRADRKYWDSYIIEDNQKTDSFVLRITEKCNNNCVFCSIPKEWKKGSQMSFGEIKRVIDSKAKRNSMLEIGGAEPTLHPDFFNIIEYANGKFSWIALTSNTRLFAYPRFADRLMGINNLFVKSSLHGHTPEIRDSITRVKGSFNQAIAGFNNLLRNKIDLRVNIVINRKNIDNLKETVDLLVGIGIKNIFFSGLLLSGDKAQDNDFAVDFEDIRKNLAGILAYLRKNGIGAVIEKLPVCIAPKFSKNFLIESDAEHFIKLKECNECCYIDRCMGINRLYMEEGFKFDVHPQNKG